MLRFDTRKEGALKVGDRAPDVSLLALDGHTRVRLSERMGERPLVVIFGSYT
jgi:peroxiredoxin